MPDKIRKKFVMCVSLRVLILINYRQREYSVKSLRSTLADHFILRYCELNFYNLITYL